MDLFFPIIFRKNPYQTCHWARQPSAFPRPAFCGDADRSRRSDQHLATGGTGSNSGCWLARWRIWNITHLGVSANVGFTTKYPELHRRILGYPFFQAHFGLGRWFFAEAPATQQAPQTAADCCNYLCSLASKTPGEVDLDTPKA